jgi:hypothetical protein
MAMAMRMAGKEKGNHKGGEGDGDCNKETTRRRQQDDVMAMRQHETMLVHGRSNGWDVDG